MSLCGRATLIEEYQRSGELAQRNIEVYRSELARREIGDLVYNQGIEKTAAAVNGIIENGSNLSGAP